MHIASADALHWVLQVCSSLAAHAFSQLSGAHCVVQFFWTTSEHCASAVISMSPQAETPAWAVRGKALRAANARALALTKVTRRVRENEVSFIPTGTAIDEPNAFIRASHTSEGERRAAAGSTSRSAAHLRHASASLNARPNAPAALFRAERSSPATADILRHSRSGGEARAERFTDSTGKPWLTRRS